MGKGLVVTKAMAAKAILFGACDAPEVGSPIDGFSTSDLIWAERLLPMDGFKTKLPLWTMSSSGYGYGYGSGDGYGDGYGSGSKYAKLPQLLN